MENNIDFIRNLQYVEIEFLPYILKTFFISICTYYTFLKITNNKSYFTSKTILTFLITFIFSILIGTVKLYTHSFVGIFCLIFLLSFLYSCIEKYSIEYCIIITIISLGINYIIFFISLTINFLPNILFRLQNDYIRLLFISIIHVIILYFIFKIKKLKNGFVFLQNNFINDYFKLLILNISITILFTFIILANFNLLFNTKLIFAFIPFSIIMVITIKKSFEIYYKQNLLIQELENSKETIRFQEAEITKLENENLNFSKTSHSIAHRQKSLEFKLNQLLLKNETSVELDLRDRINKISSIYLQKNTTIKLPKTNIVELDDMLNFMQSECIKYNIDFELKLNGNIHHMINNFIEKENLEILLADLIKNSIIAVNYSDNINRSILVKLGIIDNSYSLYVYDSGIEFDINTLLSLGQKPYTTHSDSGGTGIGFMNIFDTLRKCNASITIDEFGSPIKDNYTKAIIIKFDNKNCFKISSYRLEQIKKQVTSTNFIVE